jgi:hypothetical protein
VLETAAQFPETADVVALCAALEQAIANQPLSEQLLVGGEAILQLADVFAARAELMIAGWEYRHNPGEPEINLEDCSELFVQSLHLDVADLFEEPEPVWYPEGRRSPSRDDDSVVGNVDKDTLLGVVEEWEAEPELTEADLVQRVRELAHGEEVSAWVTMIRDFFSRRLLQVGDRGNDRRLISLPELGRAVRLEVVPLWIGLLHGSEEWQLQQTGEFYDQTRILVTVRGKKGIASDIQRTLTI